MSYTVRRATLQDLDRLAPMFDGYRQFCGRPSDLPLAHRFLADRMSREESLVLITEDANGAALGFVQLYPSFSSVRAAPAYILNDLFVSPSARRRGVGAKAAAEMGRASGAVRLTLSTEITNVRAQKLYESMGWKRNEEFYEYGLSL